MNLLRMYKKDLETKLEAAENRRANLERMAQESFTDTERRAHEDKETLVTLFLQLTANEEETIASIRTELGLSNSKELVPVENTTTAPLPLQFGAKQKRDRK